MELRPASRAEPLAALEVCDACHACGVQPVAWEEAGPLHRRITLRCPGCGHERTGVFHEDAVRRYDRLLDRAAAEAAAALARRQRADMREYAARFAAALHTGVLRPDDF